MVEHHVRGGGGGDGDVLTRLHHLRRTLQECHRRMERVDCHVQALNTHPGEVTFCALPGTSHHLGTTTSGHSHTQHGVYTFPEPYHRSEDDLERDKTRGEESQAADDDQKNEATRNVRLKDSMSEVKEAEEHLVQTEWTVVLGDLTGTFELAHDEADDELKNFTNGSVSEATSGAPKTRQRASLRSQKRMEIENYDPDLFNTVRPRDNCDVDHDGEAEPFLSSLHPDLLILDDPEANGIIPGASIMLREDVVHPRAGDDDEPARAAEKLDDHSCPSHCTEHPFDMDPTDDPGSPLDVTHSPRPPLDAAHSPGPPLDAAHSLGPPLDAAHSPGPPLDAAHSPGLPLGAAHSPGPPLDVTHSPGPPLDAAHSPGPPLDAAHSPGPPLDVTHSLDVVQKTLELLWDNFTSLQNAIGDSPGKFDHHSQETSNISSKMVKIIGCLSPGVKKGLSEDCKTVPDAGEAPPTDLPHQDPSSEGPREGEECTTQIISDNNSGKPESHSVAGAHPQHSNASQNRRLELKDSLTTVLVLFLVLLALLFLACCLLLVVPVVTVSVRTTGGPPVF
ncbi:uncharacterized protein [Panulirus ornatus]|uniref:uncharacterized protein n=1 Tax=Panulirus ornatus TaxID=150431 RepID=UPI003A852E62